MASTSGTAADLSLIAMTDAQSARLVSLIKEFKQAKAALCGSGDSDTHAEFTQVSAGGTELALATTQGNYTTAGKAAKEDLYRKWEDTMIEAFKHMNYLAKHDIEYTDAHTRKPLQDSGIEAAIEDRMLDRNTSLQNALRWTGFKVQERTTRDGTPTGRRRIIQHQRGRGRGKGVAKTQETGTRESVDVIKEAKQSSTASLPPWQTATSWRT